MYNAFLVFFFFLFATNSNAQVDTVTIDSYDEETYSVFEEEIEKDTAVIEYWKYKYYDTIPLGNDLVASTSQTYDKMIPKYQNKDFEYVESISERLNFFDKLAYRIIEFLNDWLPKPPSGNFNEGMINFLAIAGGIIFLFLVYKFFVSRNKIFINNKKESDEGEMDEIDFVEKNLMDVDIKTYIRQSENSKNFALAIRYQHLLNIQVLSENNLIVWKQNKTNMELMDSVKNEELKRDFTACSSIFDYIWFGDFALTESDYNRYAVRFQEFQRRWK